MTEHVELRVRGPLDAGTAPGVLEEIRGLTLQRGQLLVVNLAEVSFCDSSGISTLIAARNVATAANGAVALVAVPSALVRTLSMIGLGDLFPVHASVDEAVAAHGG
jgi:anti-sigma B factor antagonist